MTEAEHQQLLELLEADRLASDISHRLPRATLSPAARVGLRMLGVFAVVMSLLVIYTFAAQLH